MLERFTRERQRTAASSSTSRRGGGVDFNLDDGEDGDELTHYGQSLSALDDDFDGTGLMLEDEGGDDDEADEGKGEARFLGA